ncbi:AAA family ATPase [Nonomuraea sp. MCN248]|uniref:AAA family ATPase n=1 Tax=Nonomuraea corallina TaxID=2989783 RepID=A0ABT4SLE7_9ACTN|nr:ATP-binding protein [Nonomuraea corallina]MDA0638063.1 AAA family ATPase [Nonomuraea corallina]
MLTRIEIDGFKSFLDFELDVPPFLALVGPNSSGKSNLLDALDFVATTARSGQDALLTAKRGRAHQLFHQAVEGGGASAFEIRLTLLSEYGSELWPIHLDTIARNPAEPVVEQFGTYGWNAGELDRLPQAVKARCRDEISVAPGDEEDEDTDLVLMDAASAVDWRWYEPDPRAMRAVASAADRRPLRSDGANLAAVLGRLHETEALDPLVLDLAALIPDVAGLVPYLDVRRQEWSFDLVIGGQGQVSSALLSDGTLRILGLLAALHDPVHPGVLLIEEIENGLHPSRLAELLRRIRRLVTDLNDPRALLRPLRQVILTTHSPVVVSELYRLQPESLVFLDSAVRVDPERAVMSRVTVAKPVRAEGEPGTFVSPRQVRRYLSAVETPT